MLSEKEFLIKLAVDQFNRQFNKTIRISDCDIVSIPVRFAASYSYEISTVRSDDFLRMHIHLSLGGLDEVYPYTLQVDGGTGISTLTDEVYVASGSLDPYYIDSGLYTFKPIGIVPITEGIVVLEDGYALLLESGEEIALG